MLLGLLFFVPMKIREEGVLPESNIYFYTPGETDLKLFFVSTSCGHYFCDDKYRVTRNNYGSFLLLFVKSGRGFVHIDGKKIVITENDLFLLDCYHHHSYGTWPGSTMETIWVHFEGRMAHNYFKAIAGESNGVVLRSRNPQIVFNNLAFIYEQYHEKKSLSIVVSSTIQSADELKNFLVDVERKGALNIRRSSVILNNKYILNILTEFLLENQVIVDHDNIIREDLLTYITDNLQKPLTLEDLAGRVSLSPYYFARRFKKETGCTPHQYVLLSRINAAKHFLKATNLTVKEVAFSCGFSSESGFCIAFKRTMKISPTEYRENYT